MKTDRLTSSILFCLALAAPLAQAAPVPKQLAGPPSDFSTLRAPDPSASPIFSKSALVPVVFTRGKQGQSTFQVTLPAANGRLRFIAFAGNEAWRLALTSPSGRRAPPADFAATIREADFGMELATHRGSYYAFETSEKGDWTLTVDADAGARDGYLLLEGDPSTELASYQTHRRQTVGSRIAIVAALATGMKPVAGPLGGRLDTAQLRVTTPAGIVRTYPMADDGAHDDGAAGDGLFGAEFPAEMAGSYIAQVIGHGKDAGGSSVLRTAEHIVAVVEPSLRLGDVLQARGETSKGTRLAITLPVAAARAEQHYRAYAEVWGTDARGKPVAVAWVGGMVTPANGQLSLGFDTRWISRSGAKAPFELRSLRIEDPDHFITLAGAARVPLTLPTMRNSDAPAGEIDELMTMGPRPALSGDSRGVGSRLLLVHGYCSGGVWPASHFTSASTFLDANQSRSHDQFARLIQSFGSTWNSFGTVNHSQGGAASLHLYTYYWSGLDNATGSRLIQSVGTPYKGTNIAGILATLGSWFGVGCGSNDNLTYSGASAWLAGIPTTRRAKVNYYTTAFRTTNWWTNDYCNVATDLVLNDPEDGTTEQTNGQLSGAVNRGHTTGQCHTTGMRDPAQYQDASRNATMNANAAR
ncbi:choice-of-anchor X domain-containing protein [Tahibacter amnicola]|uniref:Conditioned medium factor n=1 Tax=Tahibacter amnicola TaxID=2976241 RepID=A0ABY6B9N2_9GAMM|nr:choice-of-anchor X domain-containing protein [Tahibacter amnicola]UXI66241.1 conditioned medium factor [Tahibacter amnicola]